MKMKNKNEITLCTIILPRLEVFFLEDWIKHNLSLGVTKIKIYNNGETPVEGETTHWRNSKERIDALNKDKNSWYKWSKKPNNNYFEDVSYEEIENKLYNLQKKYKNVEIISWVYGKDHEFIYPNSQGAMLNAEIEQKQEGWLLNLDPDEFLQLSKYNNDLNDLINKNQKINYFYFGEYRAQKKNIDIPISELKLLNCCRYGSNAQKWMCDLSVINSSDFPRGYVNAHTILNFANTNEKTIAKDEGYFIHYRGL
jgi:hypothetical protein